MVYDPIELGERRAERFAERFSGDTYACSCGNKCKADEIELLTPDPYGEPFCPRCVEAAREVRERPGG